MSSETEITVTVRLYSILRERDGQIVDSLECKLPQGSRVSDILGQLGVPDSLEVILAVNNKVVLESVVLRDQDRLAIIPAVAGGTVAL
jgi:sulfur carrier protein ThiS